MSLPSVRQCASSRGHGTWRNSGTDKVNNHILPVFVLVQERNSKYPDGGPESSRLTATARRRLGSLKSQIDTLQAQLESDACSAVYVCGMQYVVVCIEFYICIMM